MSTNQNRTHERSQAPWLTVMLREIMVKLTDKAFLISTAVSLLLIVGAVGATAYFGNKAKTYDVAVTTPAAARVVEAMDAVAKADNDKNKVVVKQVADAAEAEALITSGKADGYLTPGADGVGWEMVYEKSADSGLTRLATKTVQAATMAELATKAGMTAADVAKASVVGERSLKVQGERGSAATVMGLVFGVLFMMSAMTYGMQIATSVIEEKQSRIVEILVAAIPVRQLLAGKVLGNTVMALGQMALLVGAGLIGLSFTDGKDMLPVMSGAVGWFLLLFVAGFLAMACIWAAAGALGTRSEDVQHTAAPLVYVLMGCYMAGFLATGTWRVVLSFVPIVSSILMPVRVVEGTAAVWELFLALAINLGFAFVTVLLGERIYRRALLRTHGRMTYREALSATE